MRDVIGEMFLGEIAQSEGIGQGFDYGGLFKGVVNVAQTGIQQYQGDQAKKQAASDQAGALNRAISADGEWANALANLELAAGDATATAAAQTMVDQKRSDAMSAGAVLTPESQKKRCDVAHSKASEMVNAYQASPKDIAKAAKAHAWQKVADACSGAVAASGPSSPSDDHASKGGQSGGFLSLITTKKAGLPVWGWGLVTVGVVTAITLAVKHMRKSK